MAEPRLARQHYDEDKVLLFAGFGLERGLLVLFCISRLALIFRASRVTRLALPGWCYSAAGIVRPACFEIREHIQI